MFVIKFIITQYYGKDVCVKETGKSLSSLATQFLLIGF